MNICLICDHVNFVGMIILNYKTFVLCPRTKSGLINPTIIQRIPDIKIELRIENLIRFNKFQ